MVLDKLELESKISWSWNHVYRCGMEYLSSKERRLTTIWCFICCFKASSSHRLIGIFVLLGWFLSFRLFIYHPIFIHSVEFPKLSFDFNLNKWRALKLAKFAKTSYVSIFLSFLNFCARPNILYEYFLSEVKYKFSWPTKCQNKGPGWPPAGLFNDF